jgi:Plasmid replication region DNA-binding N-term
MPEVTSPAPRFGSPSRGVTTTDVERAADSLLRAGERPTIDKIREHIGRGSPNTINPMLDAWWKKLSARLDAGPAALHRLPESVAHVAEALWMQALDEGRRRALLEQRMTDRALAQDKERLELRSHVLTLREGEMETRVRDRDRSIAELEGRVQLLTGMLQREQASRESVTGRLLAIESELSATRHANLQARSRHPARRRNKETAKAVHRVKHPATKRKAAPTSKKRKQKSRRR